MEYIDIFNENNNPKGKDIEKLTEDDIRDFLKYLVEECKNKRRDVNTYNSAIRFMYGTTLNRVLNLKRIPLFKIQKNKPEMFTIQIYFTITNKS